MTWYIGGGSVFCAFRSATTAPWPSSVRGRTTGTGGLSAGMNSFYRVGALAPRSNAYATRGLFHKGPSASRSWPFGGGDVCGKPANAGSQTRDERSSDGADYMLSIITWPKPEH